MANFVPLKNYMFYCLDRYIADYGLKPPFLDVGCGVGDLSVYVAKKGWSGTSIDPSDSAIIEAKRALRQFPQIVVAELPLSEAKGRFQTVFLWDVIEHLEHDEAALKSVFSLLAPGGHLLLSVPSNPREWRWDDDFYGHYRRYTEKEMRQKLIDCGLEPRLFWDFSFPVFWIMRRLYTRLKSSPMSENFVSDKSAKTKESSMVNAWDIPGLSPLLNTDNFIWRLIYKIQFKLGRKSLGWGHEMFVLARKPD